MDYLVGFFSGVAISFVALHVVSSVRAARTRDRMTTQHVRDLDSDFRDWARNRRETERLAGGRIA